MVDVEDGDDDKMDCGELLAHVECEPTGGVPGKPLFLHAPPHTQLHTSQLCPWVHGRLAKLTVNQIPHSQYKDKTPSINAKALQIFCAALNQQPLPTSCDVARLPLAAFATNICGNEVH